jgi:addiction module HigA family antidote
MAARNPAKAPPQHSVHPGQHVRDTVLIPKKITVTDAAKLIGISRPGVSNFLNGKVSATPDMAARIERVFGLSAQTLLDMQATYDAIQARSKAMPTNTKAYVPPFLAIKANDVETWATSNIPARVRLAVLLRTLVNSTGIGLSKVDFPGNDDAERPGWDGFVEASEGTPWIPEGLSGWEFGVNQDIKGKADGDFAKSVKAMRKADRAQTTFVFVTPRRWPGKTAWIAAMKAKGQWRDVRAYDSSDIEQWLEQSLGGQTWFANETLKPSDGVRSLDKCWLDWANVASPPLIGTLFETAVAAAKRTMVSRLTNAPDGPTIIAADSIEEALAFLAQVFNSEDDGQLARDRGRVLVFDRPGVLPKLAQGTQNFIPVAYTRDVERELAPFARKMQTIIVYPRNAANTEPHVVLEPLNYDTFRSSLELMGYDRDVITRYSSESGRSLTVLRRRLSTVPAVRTPEWAADHRTATSLIPFLLVGTWNAGSDADQTVLALLSEEHSYDALDKEFQRLAQLNDAPVWSVGSHRGVVSKIDLLFSISRAVTISDLKRYFDVAKIVLGEDDPELDLPEDQRWAASIHGKSREFSSILRKGISETLVLLAVYGSHIFISTLAFDTVAEAARLVRELLTPLTTRRLEANDRDLPTYAEAAPEEFLSILERDLKTDAPQVFGLLRSSDTGVFGSCPRAGLLWALEGLSWNPKTLARAALILARLSEVEINDNWGNKPIGSLEAIFRVWMPQTAANHDERLAVVKLLAQKFPKIAWKICVQQLDTGHQTGEYSHKPRWRTDASGFGEPLANWQPIFEFVREMVSMVLNWHNHTPEMLCDLVEHIHDLASDDQAKVWEILRSWAAAGASDSHKAIVREKIRVTVMSRRGVMRSKPAPLARLTKAAKTVYRTLEPSDLLWKHEWLFRESWLEESADELQNEEVDFRKREERIRRLRTEALREVLAQRGLQGVFQLAEMGKAGSQIGWLMVAELLAEKDVPTFLLEALPRDANDGLWTRKSLIFGVLNSMQDQKKRENVLKAVGTALPQANFVRILLLAPFRRSTWQMVDALDAAHRETYWTEVSPDWIHDSDEESGEAVERLLIAERPRAAFACVRHELDKLAPLLLFRLVSEMAKEGKDQPGQYQLEHFYLEKAFAIIDTTPELTLEQKAGLEFVYIEALAQPSRRGEAHRIPNLEKYVNRHPEFFIQAIVWAYRRGDGRSDPSEFKVTPENAKQLVQRGYKLLEGIGRIPGHDHFGELHSEALAKWVKTVRESCTELGRLDIADICLGKLFSRAPVGGDGVWPCEPVREVMEEIQSDKISSGACMGIYNSRGVHGRGEGGDQERAIADKYRAWAQALQYSYPFIASTLLMGVTNMYENDARREDAEAGIRKRLH